LEGIGVVACRTVFDTSLENKEFILVKIPKFSVDVPNIVI